MKDKGIIIAISIIMALFATTYIRKQQVEASRSIATVNYISTYNKSNNYGISKAHLKLSMKS